MLEAISKLILTVFSLGLLVSGAYAAPISLSESQLDSVAAGGVDTVDGFVCPVITTDAVLNSPKGGELGIEGFYTIGGPDVTVPVHATNGDGEGLPSGDPFFAAPGDTDYSAIWGCCR
jgi:hypothetical protein